MCVYVCMRVCTRVCVSERRTATETYLCPLHETVFENVHITYIQLDKCKTRRTILLVSDKRATTKQYAAALGLISAVECAVR